MKTLSAIIERSELEFEDVEMESVGYIYSQEDSPRIIYSTGAGPCIVVAAQFHLQSTEKPIKVIGLTHTSGISADVSEQWEVLRKVCKQQRNILEATENNPIAAALLEFADRDDIPGTQSIWINNQNIDLNSIPKLISSTYEQQFGLRQADIELCVLYNSLATDLKHLAITDYKLEYITVLGGYKATESDPGSEMRLDGYRNILKNKVSCDFNLLTKHSYKSFINEQACGQTKDEGIDVYAFLTDNQQMKIIYERYSEQSRNQFERYCYECDSTSDETPLPVFISKNIPDDVKEYLQNKGVAARYLPENAPVSFTKTPYAFFNSSASLDKKFMKESAAKYDEMMLSNIPFKP